MNSLCQTLFTAVVTALFGSGGTGLIMYFINRHDQKKGAQSKQAKMILGLGHERIMELGEKYESRGYITVEEFDDFNTYLYEPYRAMGGNGTGEEIFNRIRALPRHPQKGVNK